MSAATIGGPGGDRVIAVLKLLPFSDHSSFDCPQHISKVEVGLQVTHRGRHVLGRTASYQIGPCAGQPAMVRQSLNF